MCPAKLWPKLTGLLAVGLLAVACVRAEPPAARCDAQGDPLPPGALARLGTVRLRHTSGIYSLTFVPDGKRVIGFDKRGEGILWDAVTGKEVRRYPLPVLSPKLLSGDGKSILHLGDSRLVQTDLGTGKQSVTTLPESRYHCCFSVSPDGKTVALVDHREVGKDDRMQWRFLLWDRAAAKVRYTSAWEDGDSARLVFAPDSRTLVVLGAGSELRLIDVASGAGKRAWQPHTIEAAELTFSPDGKTLVTSGYKSGYSGYDLRLWDPATSKLLREETCPEEPHSLTFFPDGKTLLGVGGSTLQLYDGKTGRRLRSLAALGHVETIALAPDGKTLATVRPSEQAIDLWDTATWRPRRQDPGHRCASEALVFSADGKSLLSSADYRYRNAPECDWGLRLWDVETGQERGRFGKSWGAVTGLSLSPDGKRLAVSANDHAIHLWDTATHKEVRRLGRCKETPHAPRWSADGKSLAFLEIRAVHVCDVATGQDRRLPPGKDPGSVWALSGDGKLGAVSDLKGRAVYLVEVETDKVVLDLGRQEVEAFSPDGRLLATTRDKEVILWDVARKKELGPLLNGNGISPRPLLFTPDQHSLVVCLNNKVCLWELASGQKRACFESPCDVVTALAVAPDGRTLATGSLDTTILLWDLTGQRLSEDREPDAAEAARLWRQLASADAKAAYQAMWKLALAPRQALPLLRKHVKPVPPLDAAARKRVAQLLAELDSDEFDVRTRATDALVQGGEPASPLLRQALAAGPNPEVQRRLRLILDKLSEPSKERVLLSRALEVAENMRTPEAKHYLEALAGGAPGAWLTEQAREILGRLRRQTGTP